MRAVGARGCRGCSTCAIAARCSALGESCSASSAQRALPQWRGDTFLATHRRRRASDADGACSSSTPSTTTSSPRTLHAARRVLEAAGYRGRTSPGRRSARGALCCGRTYLADRPGRRGEATRRARLLEALLPVRRARRAGRRAGAVVPAHAARRVPGAWASASAARRRSRQRACCSRSSWRARTKAGRLDARRSSRCRRRPRCCTAIATRRRSAR